MTSYVMTLYGLLPPAVALDSLPNCIWIVTESVMDVDNNMEVFTTGNISITWVVTWPWEQGHTSITKCHRNLPFADLVKKGWEESYAKIRSLSWKKRSVDPRKLSWGVIPPTKYHRCGRGLNKTSNGGKERIKKKLSKECSCVRSSPCNPIYCSYIGTLCTFSRWENRMVHIASRFHQMLWKDKLHPIRASMYCNNISKDAP